MKNCFSGNQDLFLGEYEIPHKKTPGPLNIETDEVKTIVLSPIQIKSILNEEMKLVNNGAAGEFDNIRFFHPVFFFNEQK